MNYTIVRIRRVCLDTYSNYAYLQKDTKSKFKYGLAKAPQFIQKFSKEEAVERLNKINQNEDYLYKVIQI